MVCMVLLKNNGWKTYADKIVSLWKAGEPGSCLILEEKYCRSGKFIYPFEDKTMAIGFKLPEETLVYAPYDGLTGFLIPGPDPEKALPPGIVIDNVDSVADLENDHKAVVIFADSFLRDEIHQTVVKGQVLAKIGKTAITGFEDYNLVIVADNPENRGTAYAGSGFYLKDVLSL